MISLFFVLLLAKMSGEPKDTSFWTGKKALLGNEPEPILVEPSDIEAVTAVGVRLFPGFMSSMTTLLTGIENTDEASEVLPQGQPVRVLEEPSDQIDETRFKVLIALFLLNEEYKTFQNACSQKGINASLNFGHDDYGYSVKINLSRIARPRGD